MRHTGFRAFRLAFSAALLGILALPAASQAMDTFFVGPRAMGMAGANVASPVDTTAQYYNPAAFGFFSRTETVVDEKGKKRETRGQVDNNNIGRKDWGWDVASVGGGLSLHKNLPELMDDISEIDIDALQNGIDDYSKLSDLVSLANKLSLLEEPGNGLRANMAGGTALRIMNFGLGVRAYGQGAGRVLDIDTEHFGLDMSTANYVNEIETMSIPGYAPTHQYSVFTPAQQAELTAAYAGSDEAVRRLDYIAGLQGVAYGDETTVALLTAAADGSDDLSDNTTAVEVTAFGLTEVPFTFGYAFNDYFAVGGNLKAMVGRVYATDIVVFKSESSDIVSNMTEEYEQTLTWGLDLGAMARFRWVQLGIVGRNLNTPTFNGPTITLADNSKKTFDDVKVKPQFAAGLAFIPWQTVTIEIDYDLTKNESQLEGYDTQYLRVGAEWDILRFLALRAGFYNNMAEDDIGLVYTAGLGLNLWAVRFDVGGAFSSETATYDGRKYPKEAQVVAGLSIDF